MEETIFQELRRRDIWDVMKDEKGVKKITLQHHVKDIVGNRNWGKSVFDNALDILEGDNRIITFPGAYNRPAYKLYRLLKREDPIWIQKEARIRQQQQIRNQSASVNPPSNAMQDDDGDTTMQVNDERPEETDHDDDGGVLSDAMASGVAPVIPARDADMAAERSAPGVRASGGLIAASRHGEQQASEEAAAADPSHAPDVVVDMEVDDDDEEGGEVVQEEQQEEDPSIIPEEDHNDDDYRIASEHDGSSIHPEENREEGYTGSDHGSSDDLDEGYIEGNFDDPSVHPEDNPDDDDGRDDDDDKTPVVVPPVVAQVAFDNPLYQAAQVIRPNLIDLMEEILHEIDEFDVCINEDRGGGIPTPAAPSFDRKGRFPIADVKDQRGNMVPAKLLQKAAQIRNDDMIPDAEKNAIVKAIDHHIKMCALAVKQSREQRGVPRHERYIRYKRLGWERHHIIPRSCNGTNDDVNLVYLSKTDHIIVHGHLSLMCSDPVLQSTFSFMTSKRGCGLRGVELADVVNVLNDESLLEELAIARSVHSTILKEAHAKYSRGDNLNKYETKVRKTCLSLLYFVFIFVHYL